MPRMKIYSVMDGSKICVPGAKPGPKPLPAELRRPCRVVGSVSADLRARLDQEIGRYRSESDILSEALMLWFERENIRRITVQ